ncbi:beta strand repeat-containing protein [Urbifossiella limnaea]|uniref:FG-GAP repeat protein n=1 Tax=Urbifossiella limnaea TaxID=2528023 RepID=A0A517XPT4_9BACT|nr:VCBS repeat-containing protein [Urbifossiella limnaea]QDU19520.1 FG-GAP repeat protein [Urbifossiella limnaea]
MSATLFRPAVQRLEARDTPAFTFSLNAAGTTATLVGDGAADTLVISAFGGALSHNRTGDPGVASALDWDTSVPDTQSLPAAAASRVEITTLGGGDDALRIGDGTRSASSLLATFFLSAGGAGSDSLQINDSLETAGRTYEYTADTITAPGLSVVNVGTLEFGITVLLGSGADTFNVLSSRHTLAVETNGGANVVRVGSAAAGLNQVLENVFVDADGGTVTVIADDTADATADAVNVSSFNFTGTVAGLFAGTITYDVRELTRLDVLGGSGGDTFSYASNTVTTAVSLFGGLGDDQFVLVASSGVGGTPTLAFDGGEGNDRFDVIGGVVPAGLALLIRGGDDTDLLNLGAPTGGTATVTHAARGRGTVQPTTGVTPVDFSNLEGVRLDGSPGTVIFNLPATPNPGVQLADDGGAGDPFGAAEAGRSLLAGPTLTPTRFGNPTVAAVVNGGAAADAITMAAMDTAYAPTATGLQAGGTFLRGGAAPDTFTVLPDADSLVSVDGGDPTAAPGDTLFVAGVMTPPGGAPTPSGTVGNLSYTNIEAVRFGLAGGGFAVGGATAARTFNADRSEASNTTPFGAGFAGGVRVAGADFTGDGVADLAVGTGPGVVALVLVLDGVTGAELFRIYPFETFTGGVFVAAGDITGDGRAELVVTPDENGGPRVRVFDGSGFGSLADFLGIDDANFRGGARAAVGDVTGDGFADLLVSAGFGGGPRVAGYDGRTLATARTKLFNDFFLFEQALRNGAYLAVGDVNGDGFADLIGGGGPGGGPRVLVKSGADLRAGSTDGAAVLANFFAGDVNNRGGVRVAARALDADARADIITGAGAGAGSRVTAYLGAALAPSGTPDAVASFDAFPGFTGGVFVG